MLCVYYVSILCDSQKQTKKKDLFYVCTNAFFYIGLLDKYIFEKLTVKFKKFRTIDKSWAQICVDIDY